LRPIAAQDIEKVNSLWSFSGTESSLTYLKFLHSHGFPAIAAYTAADELAGFLICNSDMALAAAYVTPELRNRGLFQAMAFEWCLKMAAIGRSDTFTFVNARNTASLKSLERLGGKKSDDWTVSYVLFVPANCDPSDPLLMWYEKIRNKGRTVCLVCLYHGLPYDRQDRQTD